jgi:hypothetical protein
LDAQRRAALHGGVYRVSACRSSIAAPTCRREQIVTDLAYWTGPEADREKNLLDLFVPKAPAGWPVLVFIHGGGWTSGDKGLRAGGADIYGNIGRFYAATASASRSSAIGCSRRSRGRSSSPTSRTPSRGSRQRRALGRRSEQRSCSPDTPRARSSRPGRARPAPLAALGVRTT